MTDVSTFIPFCVHSQLHGVEATPWNLVTMQTRKGNVAGATSGASSGAPTSSPLLCCCCCAAVVVLWSTHCGCATNTLIMCLCFVLEVGNVHVAFFFFLPDLTIFLPSPSVGFGNVDEKGQRCWCYERCFFWSADVAAAAVLLPLCCCCCAAVVVVVVLRSSCVSLLCIPKLCSFTLELGAVHASSPTNSTVLLLCGPTCSSPLEKTRKPWNFVVYSPNKTERQVPPPSPLLLMLLLQLYCLCCAMLLL